MVFAFFSRVSNLLTSSVMDLEVVLKIEKEVSHGGHSPSSRDVPPSFHLAHSVRSS